MVGLSMNSCQSSNVTQSSSQLESDPYDTVEGISVVEPERVGSYAILHPIARGAMGHVFRAINEATGEAVALKMIAPTEDAKRQEKVRTFFLREMSVLSRLNHPRVIRICDFGSVKGQLYLAMEYVPTIDLREHLSLSNTPQQIRLVAGIGCYVLDGLNHAHSQNIVHRDIKPANVLVYRNRVKSQKIGIKVADFGISKDHRHAGLSGMTHEGELRGTPAFMAPEQLKNSRDVGPASDVYSTAAVLYFYLTGMVPHQENRLFPVSMGRIIETAPIPIAQRRHDLPLDFCKVIDRALSPIDAGRFQSAIEFNQALIPFTKR